MLKTFDELFVKYPYTGVVTSWYSNHGSGTIHGNGFLASFTINLRRYELTPRVKRLGKRCLFALGFISRQSMQLAVASGTSPKARTVLDTPSMSVRTVIPIRHTTIHKNVRVRVQAPLRCRTSIHHFLQSIFLLLPLDFA
jgi:hypothetical protein